MTRWCKKSCASTAARGNPPVGSSAARTFQAWASSLSNASRWMPQTARRSSTVNTILRQAHEPLPGRSTSRDLLAQHHPSCNLYARLLFPLRPPTVDPALPRAGQGEVGALLVIQRRGADASQIIRLPFPLPPLARLATAR
jgi:hypothetical protein